MRSILIALSGVLVLASGCSSSTPSGPSGWTAGPARAGRRAWISPQGIGTYTERSTPFAGSLGDLASQRTTDLVLEYPGVRFVSSDPFPDCGGIAGLGTYLLRARAAEPKAPARVLLDAFTLRDGTAVVIDYERPVGTTEDDAARAAMSRSMCVPPA